MLQVRINRSKPAWRKDVHDLSAYNTTAKGAAAQERAMFSRVYGAKLAFLLSHRTKLRWGSMDELYEEKPVLSTEQLLHPEKYFINKLWEEPTKFDFPDLAKDMGKGWKTTGVAKGMKYNTLGEAEIFARFHR